MEIRRSRVLVVAGARPNFLKIAPILQALKSYRNQVEPILIHTGQHYDQDMSGGFFETLGLPVPDVDLGVGSGSHAEQTGKVMIAFERVCGELDPDRVVIVGDVNSTLACALVAAKMNIPVSHVEAGLRSGDRTMPEEINRLCTDTLCDQLFTTDRLAGQNLKREGIPEERIHFVGNVMIDTLIRHRELAAKLSLREELGLEPGRYATITLHRPSNVDDVGVLESLLEALSEIGQSLPIVFPIHPRTRARIRELGLERYVAQGAPVRGLWTTEPLDYLAFLHLNMSAALVFTDSGGLQEETTVLNVPCLTLRHNTERPITCEVGTNELVGNDPGAITAAARRVLNGNRPSGHIPELWDGRAGERIVRIVVSSLGIKVQGERQKLKAWRQKGDWGEISRMLAGLIQARKEFIKTDNA